MKPQIRLIALIILGIGCGIQDAGYPYRTSQMPEEIVIVKAPGKEPRNPYQEEYERMLYPTVRITAGYSTGSGVILTTKSTKNTKSIYIITAAHVVENQSIVDIELYNSTVITASVVITDTVKDLALLKPQIAQIDTDKIYTAKLASSDYQYFLFTPVYAVGCSLGLSPRPSSGILSALGDSAVEISAPILPGNSGGAVFDARTYEVIGIAVWVKVYQGQLITTMAGVVPINEIYNFLDSARKTQSH